MKEEEDTDKTKERENSLPSLEVAMVSVLQYRHERYCRVTFSGGCSPLPSHAKLFSAMSANILKGIVTSR